MILVYRVDCRDLHALEYGIEHQVAAKYLGHRNDGVTVGVVHIQVVRRRANFFRDYLQIIVADVAAIIFLGKKYDGETQFMCLFVQGLHHLKGFLGIRLRIHLRNRRLRPVPSEFTPFPACAAFFDPESG